MKERIIAVAFVICVMLWGLNGCKQEIPEETMEWHGRQEQRRTDTQRSPKRFSMQTHHYSKGEKHRRTVKRKMQ